MPPLNPTIQRALEQATALRDKAPARLLAVSIAEQRLWLVTEGRLQKAYVVSTSLRPPCNVKDSLGTPRGLHEVAEKIGAGQPPGIVFKNRVPVGRHHSELPADEQAKNLITTRILWLRGLEPGVNAGTNAAGESVDTHGRYVYIHGTNHEERLGSPASSGCVQMHNLEVIELFDAVRTGDPVWIED
jgi:hypothetical protein